jgi:hypothetical protein
VLQDAAKSSRNFLEAAVAGAPGTHSAANALAALDGALKQQTSGAQSEKHIVVHTDTPKSRDSSTSRHRSPPPHWRQGDSGAHERRQGGAPAQDAHHATPHHRHHDPHSRQGHQRAGGYGGQHAPPQQAYRGAVPSTGGGVLGAPPQRYTGAFPPNKGQGAPSRGQYNTHGYR